MGRPPASITIETDDIRTTVEELTSCGVEFVSDVIEFRRVLASGPTTRPLLRGLFNLGAPMVATERGDTYRRSGTC